MVKSHWFNLFRSKNEIAIRVHKLDSSTFVLMVRLIIGSSSLLSPYLEKILCPWTVIYFDIHLEALLTYIRWILISLRTIFLRYIMAQLKIKRENGFFLSRITSGTFTRGVLPTLVIVIPLFRKGFSGKYKAYTVFSVCSKTFIVHFSSNCQ